MAQASGSIDVIETRTDTEEDEIDGPSGELVAGWTPAGVLGDPTIHEQAEMTPDSPVAFWQNSDGEKVGIARCNKWADDGFPWVALVYEQSVGGEEGWKHTHIAKNRDDAREAAAGKADHRKFMATKERGENYFDWVERTGGTRVSIRRDDPISIVE